MTTTGDNNTEMKLKKTKKIFIEIYSKVNVYHIN